MRITFEFDLQKAVQAIAYIVKLLGAADKVKLTKLLYIADREHFLRHGYPITGDAPFAMRWGPVPSACLDALNGQSWPRADAAFEFLHVDDNRVTVRRDPGVDRLAAGEREVLDEVVRAHGAKDNWSLVGETHRYPEYREAYVEGTSRPIPYELILKHSGDARHYRHDRPVIAEATVQHMVCPFRRSEADL